MAALEARTLEVERMAAASSASRTISSETLATLEWRQEESITHLRNRVEMCEVPHGVAWRSVEASGAARR